MSTSTNETRAVIDQIHQKVFIDGDQDAIDDLIADDFVLHTPNGDQGRDEHFKGELPAVRGAFPDLAFIFEDSVAENDRVATRFRMRGTHEGKFMGIPPTGTSIEVTGIVYERVRDGKAVEAWVQRDELGMLQQLGAIPS